MKKLLSLLSVLTIIGSAVPTTIAASLYQKENKKLFNSNIKNLKRIRRNSPPSLQNLITKINIGTIEKVNKKNILKRLSEINHPILSRLDFLNNIEFENITNNSAIVRTNQNIRFGPQINDILPDTMLFTISFNSNIIDFNSILGISNQNAILDLGSVYSNRSNIVAKEFIKKII